MTLLDPRQPEFAFAAMPRTDLACVRAKFRIAAERRGEVERLKYASASTLSLVAYYWLEMCARNEFSMPLRLPPMPTSQFENAELAEYAAACADLATTEAFFEIGEFYTALLPDMYRARHGIYYTPPIVVVRMLDNLETQGVDWATARVLDPACGGAAFIAYVAERMLDANGHLSAEERLRDLTRRLRGADLDPFAAWLSAVLVDVVCLPLLREAQRRVDGIIQSVDMLTQSADQLGTFDLIVGNPPYGKTTLSTDARRRFARSLFGHANLYGLFTDMALSLAAPRGVIAFVTPTSFLGGQYFKNLRDLLERETRLEHVTFMADRDEVFSSVLQETMLTVFRRKPNKRPISYWCPQVELLRPSRASVPIEALGEVRQTLAKGSPWILPRTKCQARLVRRLGSMAARLASYGYRVATGQLVWNRHKAQFCDRARDGAAPVLWAECVGRDGQFEFRAERGTHRPFILVEDDQRHWLNFEPCVLVQRTTSKEQARRLIATVVSNEFVAQHDGYVVENHLNMLLPVGTNPVPLWVVAGLLNCRVADESFRCISGSVAVSAYELEALPLPEPEELMKAVRRARLRAPGVRFERLINGFYE